MRPAASVEGTRCTRWTPLSNFNFEYTSSPETLRDASMTPPPSFREQSISLQLKPSISQYLVYMFKRSSAHKDASSPPAPGLISMIIARVSSLGSAGSIESCIRSAISLRLCCNSETSILASSANSSEPFASSCASSNCETVAARSSYVCTSSTNFERARAFSADSFGVMEPMSMSSFSRAMRCFLASPTLCTISTSRPKFEASRR
mmetsp:Transcript_46068/g.128036  ORF Transcript_46068/g.128036 Transcript_46068/m.128036 type:complete len:206 (-) Transcript_46068:323-940(-)